MNIQDWDKKEEKLRAEVLSTLGMQQQVSVNKTDKVIREKSLLVREKTEIKEVIRYISSLSSNDDFLSEKSKNIILWSKKLGQKIESLYFNIGENLSVALWLNLINFRCTGSYHGAKGEIEAKDLIGEIRRMSKIEKEVEKKIQLCLASDRDLQSRLKELFIRKENHAICNTNHTLKEVHSAGLALSPIIKKMEDLQLESRTIKSQEQHDAMINEQNKIAEITSKRKQNQRNHQRNQAIDPSPHNGRATARLRRKSKNRGQSSDAPAS